MPVLVDWFAPDFGNDVARSEEMVPRRWQINLSSRRLDFSFPSGPRDYPWRIERWYWTAPRLRITTGQPDWPCVQIHIWRFYVRFWYGAWRWSANAQELTPV